MGHTLVTGKGKLKPPEAPTHLSEQLNFKLTIASVTTLRMENFAGWEMGSHSGNSLEVSYKAKHTLSMWPSNCTTIWLLM